MDLPSESTFNKIKEGEQYQTKKNEHKIKAFKKWIHLRIGQLEDETCCKEIANEICHLLFEKEVIISF